MSHKPRIQKKGTHMKCLDRKMKEQKNSQPQNNNIQRVIKFKLIEGCTNFNGSYFYN